MNLFFTIIIIDCRKKVGAKANLKNKGTIVEALGKAESSVFVTSETALSFISSKAIEVNKDIDIIKETICVHIFKC